MGNNKNGDFIRFISDDEMFEITHGSVGRMSRNDLKEGAAEERGSIVAWMIRG